MRARIIGAGLALLTVLSGCTAAEPAPSTGTGPATSTTAATTDARLDCDALLPVSRASRALGLQERDLTGSRDQAVRTSAEMILDAAEKNGGGLSCSWFAKKGTASIEATAAADAADDFAAAAQSGTRLATDAEAYGDCEAGRCRVDVLAGTTWVTLTLAEAPVDADLAALASETAARAVGRLDEPIAGTMPPCAELLSAEELTGTAGLVQAAPGTGTEGVVPATASALAAARAGYLSCTWTDPTSGTYAGLTVDALPHGENGWRDLSLATGLAVALTPIDGIGGLALSGCGGGSCEIDVLAADTWWRVLVTGDEERATAVAALLVDRAS